MNKNKNYLKKRRKELGLTLKDVADTVGVSDSTVSRWETGNISNMRQPHIELMAKALNASPLWIMGLSLENTTNDMLKEMKNISSRYVDLSSNFFDDLEEQKKLILIIDSLISELDKLTPKQIGDVIDYIKFLKSKEDK